MPTFRFQDGNQGFFRYNRFNEFETVETTNTSLLMEFSGGSYDPTRNPFQIELIFEGAESYEPEQGGAAGRTIYTAGTITRINFLDDDGNQMMRIIDLDASLAFFSVMESVGNLIDFFDYLNSGDNTYLGSNDASGPEENNTGDVIETGAGDDTIEAKAGNDDISDGGGADTYKGGGGTDVLSYADWYSNPLGVISGIDVKLNKGRIVGPDGETDRVKSIEDVRGTFLDDSFVGDNNRNTFTGYQGDDFFNGRGGIDIVDYRNDEFQGGLDGINADLEAGRVRDGFGNIDTLRNIEGLRGTDRRDVINDSDGGNTLVGRGGNDRFNITGGDDYIEGNDGADRFIFNGRNFGDNTIRDYDVGEGDVIRIDQLNRFNQLTISQDGEDAVVEFNNSSILLREYNANDLSADDFGL